MLRPSKWLGVVGAVSEYQLCIFRVETMDLASEASRALSRSGGALVSLIGLHMGICVAAR